jgi:arylformamidase
MPIFSEAFCNAQYNPRDLVPNHLEIMNGWKTKSAIAREKSKCFLNIAYGSDVDETLDIFLSKNKNSPCLVFIHGGYWRASDKSEFSFIAAEFAKAGATVFVVNYALAPRVTMEKIVAQIHLATQWIFKHAAQYGANPEKIYVSGHSAGGHLTTMMMTSTWDKYPNSLIKGGLSISGLYDLEPLVQASFLNTILKLDPVRARNLSPAFKNPQGQIPLWTCVGGDESSEFHRQNQLIAQAWPMHFQEDIPMPGNNHFTIMDAMADHSSPLHQGILKMLKLEA